MAFSKEFFKLTGANLREACQERGLDDSGGKQDLVDRLAAAAARDARAERAAQEVERAAAAAAAAEAAAMEEADGGGGGLFVCPSEERLKGRGVGARRLRSERSELRRRRDKLLGRPERRSSAGANVLF